MAVNSRFVDLTKRSHNEDENQRPRGSAYPRLGRQRGLKWLCHFGPPLCPLVDTLLSDLEPEGSPGLKAPRPHHPHNSTIGGPCLHSVGVIPWGAGDGTRISSRPILVAASLNPEAKTTLLTRSTRPPPKARGTHEPLRSGTARYSVSGQFGRAIRRRHDSSKQREGRRKTAAPRRTAVGLPIPG